MLGPPRNPSHDFRPVPACEVPSSPVSPDTLRDLPDIEMLEDAGLLSKDKLLAGEFSDPIGSPGEDEPQETDIGAIDGEE